MKPDKAAKLTKGISGIAGEYFVAAELSRRGFMASITLRNNDSIDIHASKNNGKQLLAIQVKTNQNGVNKWILTKKSETLYSDNLYYVFVAFKDLFSRPDYYIVLSITLAERVKKGHAKWLLGAGKKGQVHVDSTIRAFKDTNREFFERWDLIE